jgi:hypothetical protein
LESTKFSKFFRGSVSDLSGEDRKTPQVLAPSQNITAKLP